MLNVPNHAAFISFARVPLEPRKGLKTPKNSLGFVVKSSDLAFQHSLIAFRLCSVASFLQLFSNRRFSAVGIRVYFLANLRFFLTALFHYSNVIYGSFLAINLIFLVGHDHSKYCLAECSYKSTDGRCCQKWFPPAREPYASPLTVPFHLFSSGFEKRQIYFCGSRLFSLNNPYTKL